MAAKWCRTLVERIVPRSRLRVAVFCSLLALASLRCLSDFVLAPGGAPEAPRLHLRILAAPSKGAPGAALEPRIRVGVETAEGRRVDSVTASVTIRLVDGPAGVSLGGVTTAALEDGEAVFDSLAVSHPGDVRLAVFAAGFAPDTSGTLAVAWPPVAAIDLSPREIRAEALGDTVRIQAVLRDEDGRALPSVPLSWTTSNPAVVAVTPGGLATMAGNGEATIEVAVQGVTATVDVDVRQRVRRVTVTPQELTLAVLQSAEIAAAAFDANDSAVTRDIRFSWHSNRSSRVTVYPGGGTASGATLRRWRTGTVTITATLENVTGSLIVR